MGLGILGYSVSLLPAALILAFSIWMAIDSVRNGHELYWVWIILIFQPIGGIVYFLAFKLSSTGLSQRWMRRIAQRQRVAELKAEIHHLDKAYHYTKLGDIYRARMDWREAADCYRAALQREPNVTEVEAHLGYCLVALGKAEEAWTVLESALKRDPGFEYGELLWQAARCRVALQDEEGARQLYARLTSNQTYALARLEYAELLGRAGDAATCARMLNQIVSDSDHATRADKRRNRKAVARARSLLKNPRFATVTPG